MRSIFPVIDPIRGVLEGVFPDRRLVKNDVIVHGLDCEDCSHVVLVMLGVPALAPPTFRPRPPRPRTTPQPSSRCTSALLLPRPMRSTAWGEGGRSGPGEGPLQLLLIHQLRCARAHLSPIIIALHLRPSSPSPHAFKRMGRGCASRVRGFLHLLPIPCLPAGAIAHTHSRKQPLPFRSVSSLIAGGVAGEAARLLCTADRRSPNSPRPTTLRSSHSAALPSPP